MFVLVWDSPTESGYKVFDEYEEALSEYREVVTDNILSLLMECGEEKVEITEANPEYLKQLAKVAGLGEISESNIRVSVVIQGDTLFAILEI